MRAARRGVPMAPGSSASSLPFHTSPVQPHFHHPIVTSILQLSAGAGGPPPPSSPLKYRRAFIGRGEAGGVKHSRTARSYLKTVSSLTQQGKHQQQQEENVQLDYNKTHHPFTTSGLQTDKDHKNVFYDLQLRCKNQRADRLSLTSPQHCSRRHAWQPLTDSPRLLQF